jgi:mutator protein MutT
MLETVVSNNIIKAFKVELKSAVGIVFNSKGEVLLGKAIASDDRNGKWCFPGGGIDKGESPLQAAIREVYEEMGVICTAYKVLSITHPIKPKVAFCLLSCNGSTTISTNEEFEKADWFSIKSLPKDILSINLDILSTIK